MANNTIDMAIRLMGLALLFSLAASQTAPSAYVNHTVGGDAGWLFNATTNKTSADFSAWAAKQSFNLGDYLIFNTNTNQSVVQTYNATTYTNCTADESEDDDTFIYGVGGGEFGKAETIVVPLTIEGLQYYFSDGDDGLQCLNGMAFEIKVGRGLGLPPSLNQPPPPAYVPPPAQADEGESPPVTVVADPPSGGTRFGGTVSCLAPLLAVLVLHMVLGN